MISYRLNRDERTLTVEMRLPEVVQIKWSSRRVLHLFRPGAGWSVCGRLCGAYAKTSSNFGPDKFCPYCLSWAQRRQKKGPAAEP